MILNWSNYGSQYSRSLLQWFFIHILCTFASLTKTPYTRELVQCTWNGMYFLQVAFYFRWSSIRDPRVNISWLSKCLSLLQCSWKRWPWFLSWSTWARTVIPRDSPHNTFTAWVDREQSASSSGWQWSAIMTLSGTLCLQTSFILYS
jgi:hypothetical protein